MLKIIRVLTKSVPENIAIDMVENLYDGSDKIYNYDELLHNLISVIEKTINLVEFNKLKRNEKNAAQSSIFKAISQLEKNSDNTVPSGAWTHKNLFKDDDRISGMDIMSFEDEGWNYYRTWNEMKFPDVFYKKEMQYVLQNTISSAIKNTQFKTLLLHENQDDNKSVQSIKKELIEKKSLQNIQSPTEKKEADLMQNSTPGYLSFNLYPKLETNVELNNQPTQRIYPDLAGYDLTPSILKS